MNNTNIIGRMVRDPEIKVTPNGNKVLSFCVAVSFGKDKTYFIDCVAWDKVAENIAKYFHKGDKIGVSGMLTTRSYETSDGKKIKVTEVLVNSFDFCNDRSEGADAQPKATEMQPNNNAPVSGALPFEI